MYPNGYQDFLRQFLGAYQPPQQNPLGLIPASQAPQPPQMQQFGLLNIPKGGAVYPSHDPNSLASPDPNPPRSGGMGNRGTDTGWLTQLAGGGHYAQLGADGAYIPGAAGFAPPAEAATGGGIGGLLAGAADAGAGSGGAAFLQAILSLLAAL